jgi:sec-independent protein translocase protein TatA
MQFGNLGFMEIMIILVVFLLVFGAKRLPEIGQSMGKGIREFKKSISDVDKELREPARDERIDRRDLRDTADRLPRDERADDRPEPKRLMS